MFYSTCWNRGTFRNAVLSCALMDAFSGGTLFGGLRVFEFEAKTILVSISGMGLHPLTVPAVTLSAPVIIMTIYSFNLI